MTARDRNEGAPRLRAAFTDPDEVASVYDAWAPRYDQDLASWGYDAPSIAAQKLLETRPPPGRVLDVGCGTGLVGRALRHAGFEQVIGVDLSLESLERATELKVYGELRQVDFQDLPTPLDDSSFAAVVCVGVMTYLPDTAAVVNEFCRLVGPDGVVVFTQRHDLWEERACDDVLEGVVAQGTARILEVTDPLPYLPGNDEMGDVRVVMVTLRSR